MRTIGTEPSEPKFIDQLLLGWAAWARATGIDLRATQAGDLWQIASIIESRDYVIQLSDDAFILIDQTIARLPERLRTIVHMEYCSSRSSSAKARSLGLNRLAYRQRLNSCQWALYAVLMPHIDGWRQERVQATASLQPSTPSLAIP